MTAKVTPLPLPPRGGAAGVASALRRAIFDGELIHGDRLPSERRLAEREGVSRGTIRDALTALASEGLLEIRPGSGAYVTFRETAEAASPILDASPLDLIDARFALEPHICRLSVLRATRADFDEFERLMDRMEDAEGDADDFAEADSAFHTALARSTRNELLIWMVGQIGEVRGEDEWLRMRKLTLNPAVIAQYNREHRQLVNAIRSREPDRAAQLMKTHLETARLSLTRAAAT